MKAKSARSKAARSQQPQDASSLKKSSLVVAIALLLGSHTATAGPEGGQIVNGTGSIDQTVPASTVITQTSERLGIDWQSFNVAEQGCVRFDQPGSSSIALNRIFDQNPASFSAPTRMVMYSDQLNGMVFGEGAQINVVARRELIDCRRRISRRASSLRCDGSLCQPRPDTGRDGRLRDAPGGSVANEGLIIAELGQVNLGAGTRASLDFNGDGLCSSKSTVRC
jgi:large exoprotein involved in heme utilization and adhesion